MTDAQFELLLAAIREQHNELRAIHEAALGKLRGISMLCTHSGHHLVHPRWAGWAGLAGLARCPVPSYRLGRVLIKSRSGRSARFSPKVLAISAHTIFKLEQTAEAALNDALLRQIVDNLRRHPKTARQSVG